MGFSICGQMIVTFLPDGQCGLLLSSAVEVFMQKDLSIPLTATTPSRCNCGDFEFAGLVSSVSWYLHPFSQANPFALGHSAIGFGIPYRPDGQRTGSVQQKYKLFAKPTIIID